MEAAGTLRKMRTEHTAPVSYYMPLGDQEVAMNSHIGKEITLTYLGEINCIRCNRKTSKSFAQGYCYPCFTTAPETEECVLKPELCRAHEGIARDMEYAKDHCLIQQVVYLSVTSDLKVGVTRNTQVPFRWIDQGATQAIELARTPNRYLAGELEVHLKSHLKDKTNWRGMLKNEVKFEEDLLEAKKKVLTLLGDRFEDYASSNDAITSIEFPVEEYPVKVTSFNFDKEPVVSGTLAGIKGQYLLFQGGGVINIRKFGGYKISLRTP